MDIQVSISPITRSIGVITSRTRPAPFFGSNEPKDTVSVTAQEWNKWLGESEESFTRRLTGQTASAPPAIPNSFGDWLACTTKATLKFPSDAMKALPLYGINPLPYVGLFIDNVIFAEEHQAIDTLQERRTKQFNLTFEAPKALVRQGEIDQAFGLFQQALALFPEHSHTTYRSLGKFASELMAAQAGKSFYPADFDKDIRENPVVMAKLKDLPFQEIAVKAYERAAKLTSENCFDLCNVSDVYSFANQGEKAIESAQRAYKAAKQERDASHIKLMGGHLAHKLEKFGQVDKAIALLKKLFAKDKDLNVNWMGAHSSHLDALFSIYKKQAESMPEVENKQAFAVQKIIEMFQELEPKHPRLTRQFANFCKYYERPDLALPLYQELKRRKLAQA